MGVTVVLSICWKDMHSTYCLGQIAIGDRSDPYRNEPLAEPLHLAQFPIAPMRPNRMMRHEPDHSITGDNELSQNFLPLLAKWQITAVNQDVKSLQFEIFDQYVCCQYVVT